MVDVNMYMADLELPKWRIEEKKKRIIRKTCRVLG